MEGKRRPKKMDKKILKKRIIYLESEIAAGSRLDGWTLEGAKKELKKLKKQWTNTFTEEN